MRPKPREEGQRWLKEAAKDLEVARTMATAGHMNWACFVAQQAAEKAVKGYLYAQEVEAPWGHSVADLLRDAATYDASIASLQPIGGLLDKFYIPTRYPDGLPGGVPSEAYSDQEAKQAIAWAEQLVHRFTSLLGT